MFISSVNSFIHNAIQKTPLDSSFLPIIESLPILSDVFNRIKRAQLESEAQMAYTDLCNYRPEERTRAVFQRVSDSLNQLSIFYTQHEKPLIYYIPRCCILLVLAMTIPKNRPFFDYPATLFYLAYTTYQLGLLFIRAHNSVSGCLSRSLYGTEKFKHTFNSTLQMQINNLRMQIDNLHSLLSS